ncbi:J domain-containing protein [Sphingomonas lutea]|uniref:J domain-containing protein n=1 Tax=Sphingomonas lutea TaxID=1045317 RepID=A0A7G9SG13_9SPHN|nr:J domain-containing protein [Sphingomonas lutea]QNN66788.1 J domain-containing protein [Sphingomonas lutea]
MRAEPSAHAILGLEPGADRETVERAYKQLIKQHHPDREGGDSARAAQINRAYRELRAGAHKAHLELEDDQVFGSRRGLWTGLAIAAAAGSLALVAATALMSSADIAPVLPVGKSEAVARTGEPMDQPIVFPAVDEEIARAASMARGEDEIALTAASRDCHLRLRNEPSLEQFDRCAAFDYVATFVQDRDPLRDRGPFGELAVTSRLMRAGALLSSDYLAIDGRLDQLRLRTELALAPPAEPAPPVRAEAVPD